MEEKHSLAGELTGIIKTHKKEVIVIVGLLFFVVAMGLTCAFNVKKNIKVVVDNKTPGSAQQTETKTVNANLTSKVADVLNDEGVAVTDNYTVNTDMDSMAKDVDEIKVTQKVQGTITADGKQTAYDSTAETVGDLLNEKGITVDGDDEVTPMASTKLTTDINAVTVVRIETKDETSQKAIPFETEKKENADLENGQVNIITQGVDGVANVTDRVTYRDGAEASRQTLSSTTVQEPVKQVEEEGTKLANGGNLSSGNSTTSLGSDADLVYAVVQQEGGSSYEGALAVISCMMNRVDQGRGDLVSVIKAPGQFAAYLDGAYTKYLGNSSAEVKQAVTDCVEGGKRSHSYVNFRSYPQSDVASYNICGNWYFN